MAGDSAKEVEIGDAMPDGTVYAGVSPESGKAMFTTAADAPATCTFEEAQEYAAKLDAHGHQDWRVPTKGELKVLFVNRKVIGGFEESGSDPVGWYWSSSPSSRRNAWAQRFSEGYQDTSHKYYYTSVRCVR
jgi:hypothetical protein